MSPAKVLDSVASVIGDAFIPRTRRAMTMADVDRGVAAIRRDSVARKRRTAGAYRHRWIQLSEQELADIVQRRFPSSHGTRSQ